MQSILEVSTFINFSTSEKIKFLLLRKDQEISVMVKPNLIDGKDSLGNPVKKRIIGIKLSTPYNNEFKKQPLTPSKAVYHAFKEVWFVTTASLNYLGKLVIGKGDSSQLGGPIRISKITGQVAEYGIIPFLSIMAYISISLGLINLFPIPMLDGGHLVLYIIEIVIGKPINKNVQEKILKFGFVIIITLAVLLTYNDIINLFKF